MATIKKGRSRTVEGWTAKEERQWQGPYFFVQGSDTQFGMIESFAEGLDSRGWAKSGGWQAEIELLSALIAKLNAMRPRPKFFVICGDLVDAYPQDEPRRGLQEKDFQETLSNLDPEIPVVCVCGNHDVGDRPTAEDIRRFTDEYGDDYFDFWIAGVHYLVLNSQLFKDPSLVLNSAAEQEAWLNKTLNLSSESTDDDDAVVKDTVSLEDEVAAPSSNGEVGSASSLSPARHSLAFMHIPPFLASPDEEDDVYFNLPSERRKTLLRKLYQGGIRKIFCGHYHRNAGGHAFEDLEVVVTSAVGAQLGKDVSGARIVTVLENEVLHRYYPIDDLPEKVDLFK